MKAALKTVLSGMIGIRRRADHERQRINPVHVVIAGVVLAALFILTLVAIVRIVTG
ncbi:MAG: DUF2970 domain-containing protein [Burkholderiales bacterium]